MTSAVDSIIDEFGFVADYLPGVRGHAVLATGLDVNGNEALAVWRLGPTGSLSGAWILSLEAAEQDRTHLSAVMGTLLGRSLVGWTEDAPARALSTVAHLLSARLVDAFTASIAVIPDLLNEVSEHRTRYTAAVEAHRIATKSKLVPLAWACGLPADPDAAKSAVFLQPSFANSPVAAAALGVVGSLRRAVELWQDTEQVRYRRSYLRSLGEPQRLPPRWLAHLRATESARSRQD
ncbi:DUF6218 family protein [Couchioplanes azureus]|uniref:DUF6218 family protein n=1 Tax=Couchioplanes caeruleus TaxID=56438 RepID=UPI001670F26E|nr:DUF6218 family protein [Couchioplanes caeruleus]GGQ83957.1 hypothetical protein GCM10010166_62740 [Couchioplanes caeruleus subsp. azureus]